MLSTELFQILNHCVQRLFAVLVVSLCFAYLFSTSTLKCQWALTAAVVRWSMRGVALCGRNLSLKLRIISLLPDSSSSQHSAVIVRISYGGWFKRVVDTRAYVGLPGVTHENPGQTRRSGERKSPSGVQGQNPDRGLRPPEAEWYICIINYILALKFAALAWIAKFVYLRHICS